GSMAFEGFKLSQVALTDPAGDVSIRVRHGGSGPPVLLLHGYPETHMMWARVAEGLAKDFTVVVPDLRGYGGSIKPPSSDDNETSSKRAMARDAVALMKHFGFDHFAVAGHGEMVEPEGLHQGDGVAGHGALRRRLV